jgi:hypothetical protein
MPEGQDLSNIILHELADIVLFPGYDSPANAAVLNSKLTFPGRPNFAPHDPESNLHTTDGIPPRGRSRAQDLRRVQHPHL